MKFFGSQLFSASALLQKFIVQAEQNVGDARRVNNFI